MNTVSRVTPASVACVTTTQPGRTRGVRAHHLVQFDPGEPLRLGAQAGVARLLGREPEPLDGASRSLITALEAHDPVTGSHSGRVTRYALTIGRELGLDPSGISRLRLGAELHDIGKIGVPDELLRRAGPLSHDEHRQVLEHTVIGEQILRPLLDDRPIVLAVVRSHHEWFDGSGFPDGLTGSEIPLEARIVAVADSLDAMTSERPYRRPRPLAEALGELVSGAGSQFDPECVRALLAVLLHSRTPAGPGVVTGPGLPQRIQFLWPARQWLDATSIRARAARGPPRCRGPTPLSKCGCTGCGGTIRRTRLFSPGPASAAPPSWASRPP